MLYTPRSRYRYPRGATSPWTQVEVPFLLGWSQADHPRPVLAKPKSEGPRTTPRPPSRPQPQTTPVPIPRGGHIQRRARSGPNEPTNQSRPKAKQSQSVCISCCVFGQDTLPSLPADGGQRARWRRLYGSLAPVSLPQGSYGYNVAYHCWCVNLCMNE
ncbi:hypothetical protein CHARACLAT_021498 [Characodon lateralis]|uniref:Uncharacterized protein n=1 Tax=Characodon lateralis TaxID=208331 RepID=A0ABU7EEK5_9TELE|nr:hypothetical protein [Characodon lateralis]